MPADTPVSFSPSLALTLAFALALVARHYAQQRVPLFQDTPYCVLLENADNESEDHAREPASCSKPG